MIFSHFVMIRAVGVQYLCSVNPVKVINLEVRKKLVLGEASSLLGYFCFVQIQHKFSLLAQDLACWVAHHIQTVILVLLVFCSV